MHLAAQNCLWPTDWLCALTCMSLAMPHVVLCNVLSQPLRNRACIFFCYILAVQRFTTQTANGRHRWLVPVAPLPTGLGALNQQLQQPQFHVDLFQLYEEAVTAGGLSAVSTPMAMWRHMAMRGVAGVPGNGITGEQLRMVSMKLHAIKARCHEAASLLLSLQLLEHMKWMHVR